MPTWPYHLFKIESQQRQEPLVYAQIACLHRIMTQALGNSLPCCVRRLHAFDSACHPVQAGFGMTNPDPLYHPRNLTMFDPSPPGPQPDDDILPKAAHTLGNLLATAAGICHGLCKVHPENNVALCSCAEAARSLLVHTLRRIATHAYQV